VIASTQPSCHNRLKSLNSFSVSLLGDLFEIHQNGAVVFKPGWVENNLLIPPCSANEREHIIGKILPSKRHKHFGSMRSSQALAQSVFGTIEVLRKLPLLSAVKSEDGRPAFGPMVSQANLDFEKEIQTLGEPRRTSIDVWFEGRYRVAVECKMSEDDFGTCSRPRLKPDDPSYATQYCDGSYTYQRNRTARCSLTTLGVRYWDHTEELFGWPRETDHPRCPLASRYQLVRNILAACVDETGARDLKRGHALIIYDARNPSMVSGGEGDRQWSKTSDALKKPELLRRLLWQAFISQWPKDPVLGWLKQELVAKYGLI
jgi:hypothetical protein